MVVKSLISVCVFFKINAPFPTLDVKKYLRLPVSFFHGKQIQIALSMLKVADPCRGM